MVEHACACVLHPIWPSATRARHGLVPFLDHRRSECCPPTPLLLAPKWGSPSPPCLTSNLALPAFPGQLMSVAEACALHASLCYIRLASHQIVAPPACICRPADERGGRLRASAVPRKGGHADGLPHAQHPVHLHQRHEQPHRGRAAGVCMCVCVCARMHLCMCTCVRACVCVLHVVRITLLQQDLPTPPCNSSLLICASLTPHSHALPSHPCLPHTRRSTSAAGPSPPPTSTTCACSART